MSENQITEDRLTILERTVEKLTTLEQKIAEMECEQEVQKQVMASLASDQQRIITLLTGKPMMHDVAAPRVATAQDASGKITIGLFQETATDPQQHFTNFPIRVDSDMIVVGGGGRGDETVGALLTASFPGEDGSTWFVSSKDHMYCNPHYLVGFAIGMKIEGMSRDELLNTIRVFKMDVDPCPHPEATVSIPDDYILLGGGFNVLWEGEGNLATASFPTYGRAWTARSKDHDYADPSSLIAYAIGIRQQLPVGTINQIVQSASSAIAAHPRSTAVLPNGFVTTGGGAVVHWRSQGNLLWNLEPHASGFTAAAKDHHVSDPSSITTYALGIQLQ